MADEVVRLQKLEEEAVREGVDKALIMRIRAATQDQRPIGTVIATCTSAIDYR